VLNKHLQQNRANYSHKQTNKMKNNNTPVTGILELLHSGEPTNIELARALYPSATGLTSEWDFLERFFPVLAKYSNHIIVNKHPYNRIYLEYCQSSCFDWFSKNCPVFVDEPDFRIWESVEFGKFYPKKMRDLNVYRITDKYRNGTRAGQILGLQNTKFWHLNIRGFGTLGLPDFGKEKILSIERISILQTLVSEQDILSLPDMPNLKSILIDKPVRAGFDLSVFARFPKAYISLTSKVSFTFEQIKKAEDAGKKSVYFDVNIGREELEKCKIAGYFRIYEEK